MNADENKQETQEQSLKDFMEYHISISIQELQELEHKEELKAIQGEIENEENDIEKLSNAFSIANAIKNHKVLQEIQIILSIKSNLFQKGDILSLL